MVERITDVQLQLLGAPTVAPDSRSGLPSSIIDSLPLRVYALDRDGSTLFAKHPLGDSTAHDATEQCIFELFQAPCRGELRVAHACACEHGDHTTLEVQDLSGKWCRVDLAPLEVRGARVGAVLTSVDITDRKRQEKIQKQDELQIQTRYRLIEALSVSERKARQRVEKLQEVVFEIDADGNLAFVNGAWNTLLGYNVRDSLGKSLVSFVWEDDRRNFSACLRCDDTQHCPDGSGERSVSARPPWCGDPASLMNSEYPVGPELRLMRADLTAVWVSMSFARTEGDVRLGVIHDLSERKAAELAVQRANEKLEVRIAERTRELRATHAKLLDASRVAGMAEVATGILHNVGNVLNSVSVSVSLVDQHIRSSKATGVRRVATLLEQNSGQLAEFLTADAKGRMVPDFLSALAEQVESEQERIAEEVTSLRRNVEHIKNIIVAEQTAASVSGVVEFTTVEDVVTAAIDTCRHSCAGRGIRVEVNLDTMPPAYLDRHRIMQILVNLLRNAKDALDDSRSSTKVLKLRATLSANDRLRVTVTDNGVGVDPANLPRLFEHGFTTKVGGHGFGLHSSANAAQAMGGMLSCECEGETVFTLELPFRKVESAP